MDPFLRAPGKPREADSGDWVSVAYQLAHEYEASGLPILLIQGSKASRNIMYSCMVHSYLVRDKINLTLQSLNEAVMADLNKLSTQGVQVGDEALGIERKHSSQNP